MENEVVELRKDKARLNFLIGSGFKVRRSYRDGTESFWCSDSGESKVTYQSQREAIDSAMNNAASTAQKEIK